MRLYTNCIIFFIYFLTKNNFTFSEMSLDIFLVGGEGGKIRASLRGGRRLQGFFFAFVGEGDAKTGLQLQYRLSSQGRGFLPILRTGSKRNLNV